MSVPAFLRDRHVYWLKLTLRFRMQFFVALFADADELSLAGVRIPDGKREIRTVCEVLDVVDNARFSVSFFLVFASLTFVSVQLQNCLSKPFPSLPAVEQVGRSCLDQVFQFFNLDCQETHLRAKQKAPKPRNPFREIMAQALVTLDAGTGSAIFTILSCRHSLHLQGRFLTDVSGRIFSSFPFPHIGQIAHPSRTCILPQACNNFHSFLLIL